MCRSDRPYWSRPVLWAAEGVGELAVDLPKLFRDRSIVVLVWAGCRGRQQRWVQVRRQANADRVDGRPGILRHVGCAQDRRLHATILGRRHTIREAIREKDDYRGTALRAASDRFGTA